MNGLTARGFPTKLFITGLLHHVVLNATALIQILYPVQAKNPKNLIIIKYCMVLDCEKCHGPAAMHVEYETQNPK